MVNSGMKVKRARQNDAQAVVPGPQARHVAPSRRIGSPLLRCELLEQRQSCLRPSLQVPIDVFDQDDRGIDDDAEIDGAHRQQIGVFVEQHQNDDREEQRERNVHPDDDRAAQVAEEQPLDEEDQEAAVDQIVQHRRGGDVNERGAVVERHQLHARRQTAVGIDLLNLGADPRHHVVGM
jgi:hypothetical protein